MSDWQGVEVAVACRAGHSVGQAKRKGLQPLCSSRQQPYHDPRAAWASPERCVACGLSRLGMHPAEGTRVGLRAATGLPLLPG